MENLFEKWDAKMKENSVEKEMQPKATSKYKEAGVGDYDIKVEKMELKQSKKGDPMFFAQMRILEGKYKDCCLFMNQVVTQAWQIEIVNKFIKSLKCVDANEVQFKTYSQYNNLIESCLKECEKLEFQLSYEKSQRGFPVYTVKKVYEVA